MVQQQLDPDEVLRKVHGGRNLHFGARRTRLLLNKKFPGHRIPYSYVQEFISNCAICQKDRLRMTDNLQPVVRHIKPPHQRSRVGVDRLTVTPVDKNGNNTLIVMVEHIIPTVRNKWSKIKIRNSNELIIHFN